MFSKSVWGVSYFIYIFNGNFYCGGNIGSGCIDSVVKYKYINWYSWFITIIVFRSVLILLLYGYYGLLHNINLSGCEGVWNSYFIVDFVGFYLRVLTILLLFSLSYVYNKLSSSSILFIVIRVSSSLLCFGSKNVFMFWWFYEVSILSLLYLIILESPYSERFLASWYLAGYVVLTSLPMMVCLIYFVIESGRLVMREWNLGDKVLNSEVAVILGLLFVTKIPIFPFHVWLPIVHAEATSVVSVCLSGYIMKLGLLGVCRFSWWVIPTHLFNRSYVRVALLLSLLFFLIASWELDGKRWLAFIRLAHIVICMVCLKSAFYKKSGLMLVYSVGHGLSAGLVFIYLWWGYEMLGSRNWMVLKSLLGGRLLYRQLICLSLCTAASFPFVVQFFVEVGMLARVRVNSFFIFLIFCFYIFLGSLVPLFLVGLLLSRQFCVNFSSHGSTVKFSNCVVYFIVWSFFICLVI